MFSLLHRRSSLSERGKITQRLHPGTWLTLHSAQKEWDLMETCMLCTASLFYKPLASLPCSQSIPSQLDYITKWSQLQMSMKSCCLIWVQRNTLCLVVKANEGRQLRRQEPCSCVGLGLQGHPEPQSKQKHEQTPNLECQIFRDFFSTDFFTYVPLSLKLPHSKCVSVLSELLYFSFLPSHWEVAAGIKKASGKSSGWKRHAEKRAD